MIKFNTNGQMDTKPRKILKHALHLKEDVDEC